jgi:hypothetical protein
MNISGQVVKTSQLPKKTLGLGDSLLALINSPLETVTVPVSEFVTFVSNQVALGTYTLDTVTTAGNTTTNVINVGGVNSPYLQLNTVSPGSQAVGRFVWNDTDGTVDLRLKGNNVTLQLGQETVVRVVNKTGADLLESQYKVVRVRIASEGGAQGQRLAVVLAQGNNDPDSVTTLGIVTEDIGNNQEGFITVFGNVNEINTTGSLQGETWADGDVLFLSPTTPGGLTKVKPVAPQHTVVMGYVVYAHQNNGKIFVKVDNGYELEELHDVLPTPYVNNGVLYRDTTANLWRSATISTLLGGTPLLTVPTLSQVTTAGNTTTNAITTGGLTVGTDLIYTDTVNSRVGFGTTSPTTTLDVRTSGQGYITIGGADGRTISAFSNAGVASVVNFSSANVGGFLYANNWYDTNSNTQSIRLTTTTISLWTASTERLRIANSGNILVGTTTDAGYKLDVNGTLRINSSIFGQGTTNTYYQIANSDYHHRFFTRTDVGATLERFTIEGGAVSGKAYFQNTNVGIGTTTPAEKLQVAGNIRIQNETGLITDFGPLIGRYNTSQVYVGTGGSYSIVKIARTDDGGLNALSNGNVGIGTASPTSKLEVVGTTKISATFGSELAPALTSGNWTTSGGMVVSGSIAYTTGTVATATPVTAITPVVGQWYKVTYTVTGGYSANSVFSFGGTVYSLQLGTNTVYLNAVSTSAFQILALATTNPSFTITALSIVQQTSGTGTLTVDGAVTMNNTLAISSVGIGTGTATPTAPLQVVDVNSNGIRVTRNGVPSQYIAIHEGGGAVHTIETIGEKPFRLNNTATTGFGLEFYTQNTARGQFSSGGNFLVGTTTDAGYKLDVTGTIRATENIFLNSQKALVSLGNSVPIRSNLAGGSGYIVDVQSYNTLNGSNVEQGFITLSGTYAPTSVTGTPSFNGIYLAPTINQTGGANGTTRGLYVNPTITSAATWRSIEWSNSAGWGLFGVGTAPNYLGGSLVLGTTTVNASALLQVESTTKGFLPPRMTTAQILLISSPAEGLQVYNTDLKTICFYNGTAWQRVTSTAM